MLSQLVKRSIVNRVAVRAFSSAPVRNNAVQDLYVKELRAFKPTPLSAKDAEGSVRPWATPVAPKIPALEVDAATQLADYEASAVEVAAPASTDASGEAVTEEWFVLEEPEDDHHH